MSGAGQNLSWGGGLTSGGGQGERNQDATCYVGNLDGQVRRAATGGARDARRFAARCVGGREAAGGAAGGDRWWEGMGGDTVLRWCVGGRACV